MWEQVVKASAASAPRLPEAGPGAAQPSPRAAPPVRRLRGAAGWLGVFLLACVALVLVSLHGYRAISEELTDAALSRRVAIAELAAATVEEKFEHLVDVGVALSTRVHFRRLVAEGRWDDAVRILEDVPRNLPFIERLFLADPAGTLMADVPRVREVHGVSFAHRDWYRGVSRNWTPYVSPVYRRAAAPRNDVFAVAVPIRGDGGDVAGILVLQMQVGAYFQWTRAIEVGEAGTIFIVDARGEPAYHTARGRSRDLAATVASSPVMQRVRRGERGIVVAHDPVVGEEAVSAYSPVPKYEWGVVVQQPARAAFAARDQQVRRLLVAYSLVVLLCAGVILLGLRIVAQRRDAAQARDLRAELERRVAERTSQLAAANKELESFSYSVSHDLRTPLRAIDGFSRILEEDYRDRLDEEGRRVLRTIRDGSRRMGELIDDLLEFSRLGRKPLALTEVDMTQLAREALGALLLPGEHPPGLSLQPLPPARGDPVLLKQVWTNLLGNAIKFSARREHPLIEVSGTARDGEHVYCVRDNGAGFDMRYYDKLFGVFQRLHGMEEFPGTGVGLAIVQRVIARHGGRVWAEGRVGIGAAFYFSLPETAGQGA